MKKLLLITFLFLITPDAKADMDYVCVASMKDDDFVTFIEENCERNNILFLQDITILSLSSFIAYYCRQDREINYIQRNHNFDLTCVLYDNKIRKIIPFK